MRVEDDACLPHLTTLYMFCPVDNQHIELRPLLLACRARGIQRLGFMCYMREPATLYANLREYLDGNAALQCLKLFGMRAMEAEDVRVFGEALHACSSLTELTVSWPRWKPDWKLPEASLPPLARVLAAHPRLQRLSLEIPCSFLDTAVRVLLAPEAAPALRVLALSCYGGSATVRDAALSAALAATLPQNMHLRVLHFSFHSLSGVDAAPWLQALDAAVRQNTSLRLLIITGRRDEDRLQCAASQFVREREAARLAAHEADDDEELDADWASD